MIGCLPRTLRVNDVELEINADYRNCLTILQAFADPELNENEKYYVLLKRLYIHFEDMEESDYREAVDKAIWFLNCGDTIQGKEGNKPTYDWEKDEQVIFSAVNKVAGHDVRSDSWMHFWTFMGYFMEIGESTFATMVRIRSKRNKNQKLEKWEQEYYNSNRQKLELKSANLEQQKKISELSSMLK